MLNASAQANAITFFIIEASKENGIGSYQYRFNLYFQAA